MDDRRDIGEERERDHFVVVICVIFIISRGLWHNIFYFDVYSLLSCGIALVLVYRIQLVQFFANNHLKKMEVGSKGISLEFDNHLESLVQETDNTRGEGQMVDPMTDYTTTPSALPPVDPHKFVVAPEQHRQLIKGLSESIGALKTVLVGEKDCLLVEAIFLASQQHLIDAQTKDLLLKLNGTLQVINQFPQFITSGQILMAQYVCDSLRVRVKAIPQP
jgi:hypothetical protein